MRGKTSRAPIALVDGLVRNTIVAIVPSDGRGAVIGGALRAQFGGWETTMTKGYTRGALLIGWLVLGSTVAAQTVPTYSPSGPMGLPASPQVGLSQGEPHGTPPPHPNIQDPPFLAPPPGDGIAITEFPAEATAGGYEPCWAVRFDYLLWWAKNRGVPALATSGFTIDNPPGAVGQLTTREVIGGITSPNFDANNHTGIRAVGSVWLDSAQTLGLEAGFFYLFQRTGMANADSRTLSQPGDFFPLVLARPFFNLTADRQDAVQVSNPGVTDATITVSLPRTFWGANATFRCMEPFSTYGLGRWGLLFGYTYLNYQADLNVDQTTFPTNAPPQVMTRTSLSEQLKGSNQFNGGAIGAEYEARYGPWVLNLAGKVSMGALYSKMELHNQFTSTNVTGATVTSVADTTGVLVRPTNVGSWSKTQFSYVPELAINLSYDFNPWVRVTAGYTLLYWDKVVEPEDQIDPFVNAAGMGRPSTGSVGRPAVRLKPDDFWMQGLNVGLQFSF